MSHVTKDCRVSVPQFARVPVLLDLPEIKRPPASISASNCSFIEGGLNRAEGCLVTRSIKYTHQLVHWINDAREGDSRVVEHVIGQLRIMPCEFAFDDAPNLAFPFVHTSLDRYAFIAVTPSLPTLDSLIEMVGLENNRQQLQVDAAGVYYYRSLDFSIWSYTNPEYELVALHPEHFLPCGSALTIYDPTTRTSKNYVPATDRRLRESSDPSSPRLPAFHFQNEKRPKPYHMNVFLVVLNADIKFRRYFEMTRSHPPATPLPDDVLTLMRRTMDLAELIYYEPVPAKGSPGEPYFAGRENPRREGPQDPPWPADADLETRMAYGRALMSGHDLDYDPALFEDAIPLEDEHLFSATTAVEEWSQGVEQACQNATETS